MANKQAPAHRARQSSPRRPQPTVLELRIRDLSRLRAARYGEAMPDTPQTRTLIKVIIQHLAALPGTNAFQTVPNWLSLYAPWCTKAEAAALLADVLAAPKFYKAAELGWTLKLSDADRRRLRITTIGAFDMSPQQRAKQRKLMKRLEREEKRRLKGAIPRAQYEAKSLSKSAPWLAEGISRRTWYRRRR